MGLPAASIRPGEIRKAYDELANLNKELDKRVVEKDLSGWKGGQPAARKPIPNLKKVKGRNEQMLRSKKNNCKRPFIWKELNELKSDLSLRHEFRTPLATILSSAPLFSNTTRKKSRSIAKNTLVK